MPLRILISLYLSDDENLLQFRKSGKESIKSITIPKALAETLDKPLHI